MSSSSSFSSFNINISDSHPVYNYTQFYGFEKVFLRGRVPKRARDDDEPILPKRTCGPEQNLQLIPERFRQLSEVSSESLERIADQFREVVSDMEAFHTLRNSSLMNELISNADSRRSLNIFYQLALQYDDNRQQFIHHARNFLMRKAERPFIQFIGIIGIDLHSSDGQELLKDIFYISPELLYDFIMSYYTSGVQGLDIPEQYLESLCKFLQQNLEFVPTNKLNIINNMMDNVFLQPGECTFELLSKCITISRVLGLNFESRLPDFPLNNENWPMMLRLCHAFKIPALMDACSAYLEQNYDVSIKSSEKGICVKVCRLTKNVREFLAVCRLNHIDSFLGVVLVPSRFHHTQKIVDFLALHGDTVTELRLKTKIDILTEKQLGMILDHCPKLQTLAIKGKKITSVGFEHICRLRDLTRLEMLCPALEAIPPSIQQLTNLTSISILDGEKLAVISDQFSALSRLRHVRIVGTSLSVQLRFLQLLKQIDVEVAAQIIDKLPAKKYIRQVVKELFLMERWDGQEQLLLRLLDCNNETFILILNLMIIAKKEDWPQVVEIIPNTNFNMIEIIELINTNPNLKKLLDRGLVELTIAKYELSIGFSMQLPESFNINSFFESIMVNLDDCIMVNEYYLLNKILSNDAYRSPT